MKPVCLVTGNQHKVNEFSQLVGDLFKWDHQKMDIPELQGTPLEVATSKCKEAATIYKGPVITEDVSFVIKAWGELPGVYIKHFLDSVGPQGIYKMTQNFEDKRCYAQCIYCYCSGPEAEPIPFVGICDGLLVSPRGDGHFGAKSFDPIIEVNGKTYAEMSLDEKNAISHRGKASILLKEFLKTMQL